MELQVKYFDYPFDLVRFVNTYCVSKEDIQYIGKTSTDCYMLLYWCYGGVINA